MPWWSAAAATRSPQTLTLTDAARLAVFRVSTRITSIPIWYGGHAVPRASCSVTTPNNICVAAPAEPGAGASLLPDDLLRGPEPTFAIQRSWSWVYQQGTLTPIWYQDPSGFVAGQPCTTAPPAMLRQPAYRRLDGCKEPDDDEPLRDQLQSDARGQQLHERPGRWNGCNLVSSCRLSAKTRLTDFHWLLITDNRQPTTLRRMSCPNCPCPLICLGSEAYCLWAAEEPADPVKLRHICARSAGVVPRPTSPGPETRGLAETIALVKAMKACPFRSTDPGCGCAGGRCSLRRGSVVSHPDCFDCLRRYAGPS